VWTLGAEGGVVAVAGVDPRVVRQNLDRQHDALNEAGVDRIFEDKISGAKFDRQGLNALLEYVREGDVVIVQSLDRLGRSLSEIIRTANDMLERGIVLRTLKEGIDYSTPVGQMIAGVFGSLAQYERTLINERAADARAAAKARGKQTGRPRALSTDQVALARRMRAAGESVATICATLKISRATLYRVLGGAEPEPVTG
jgi:DNA invertase Pin-like site-specific DNA recombinase